MPRALALAALCLSLPAAAQDAPPPQPEPAPIKPAERQIGFELRAGATHTLSSDFDGSPGEVAVSRFASQFEANIPIRARSLLSLTFGTELSSYDFERATGFVPGVTEPWNDAVEYSLSANLLVPENDHWAWYAGALVDSAAESGADFGDSVSGGGYGGFSHKVNDNLSLGLGVGIFYTLEEDPGGISPDDHILIVPLPTVEWRIAEQWRLTTNPVERWRVAGGGVSLALVYSPSETWDFALAARYESRAFALDDNGPIPGGVGADRGFPVALSARWKPTPNIEAGIGGGVVVGRTFRAENSNGNEIADLDVDPGLILGAGLRISF